MSHKNNINKTKRIKAVIFDFDDTIVITKDISLAWHKAAAARANMVFDEKKFLKNYGKPWPEILYDICGDKTQLLLDAIDAGDEFSGENIKGADETINELASKKILLGLLSSSPRKILMSRLQKEISSNMHFDRDAIICKEDVKKHKPDPSAFQPLIEMLAAKNISKDEMCYCGDMVIDYQAAKNAGICFIGVTTGGASKDDFMIAGLDESRIIPSIKEFPAKITDLRLI